MFQALESVLDALRLVMLDFEIFGVACATGEAATWRYAARVLPAPALVAVYAVLIEALGLARACRGARAASGARCAFAVVPGICMPTLEQ